MLRINRLSFVIVSLIFVFIIIVGYRFLGWTGYDQEEKPTSTIIEFPTLTNWQQFYPLLEYHPALSTSEIESVSNKIRNDNEHTNCPTTFSVSIRGYAKRWPTSKNNEFDGNSQCFKPHFSDWETPKGLADKVSWSREICFIKQSGYWQVDETLWFEVYFMKKGYPFSGSETQKLYETKKDQRRYTLQRNSISNVDLNISQILDFAKEDYLKVSPLLLPFLYGRVPLLIMSKLPESGYCIDIDREEFYVLTWPVNSDYYSNRSDCPPNTKLTVILNPKIAYKLQQIVLYDNQGIKLYIKYDDYSSLGGDFFPKKIEAYRARIWRDEKQRKSAQISNTLKISLTDIRWQ